MAEIEKRKNKKGEISYRVKIRLKGFPTQYATFKRLTDARRWEQQTESAIREGRYFSTAEVKKYTLAEAVDRYMKDILPKKSIWQLSKCYWWKEKLGHMLLSDITPALLAKHRDELTATTTIRKKLRTPSTANRYLGALKRIFNIAIKEWEWMETNPVYKMNKLKEPRGSGVV